MSKHYFGEGDHNRIDHLAAIFCDVQQVTIVRGRLEQLEAVEREVRALATELVGPCPEEPTRDLDTILVQGSVLRDLFKLVR